MADQDALADPLAINGIPATRQWDIECRVRSIRLAEGLHALTIGAVEGGRVAAPGFALPATHVAAAPGNPVEIISISGRAPGWVGGEGGIVFAKVPAAEGIACVVTYGLAEGATLPPLRITRLDRAANAPAPTAELVASDRAGREIPTELTLHTEREGDRRVVVARGWSGDPRSRLRLEGFAIRPLEAIAAGDIEYSGFSSGGRRTPWVTDAKLCGTRGRGVALTGFAVRVVPALHQRFDVLYRGYFFDSGAVGPCCNGEPCRPATIDDPLAAIEVRLIERAGG